MPSKNNYLFNAYYSNSINDSNNLGIRCWTANNTWSDVLFKFCQNGTYIITSSTQSTNATSGCLQIGGGCGIQKDLYCSGNINGTLIPTNSGGSITGINSN